MIVADGELAWGTIGGGNLEKQAVEHATRLLAAPAAASESVEYPLSEKVGQCCGGTVTLFYESFRWTRRRVVVFGAGHVGQALAGLAPYLQADVTLIDGRDEAEIRPRVPSERPYELVCIDAPEAEVDALPDDALVVVMTHSHALDLQVVERALRRPLPLPRPDRLRAQVGPLREAPRRQGLHRGGDRPRDLPHRRVARVQGPALDRGLDGRRAARGHGPARDRAGGGAAAHGLRGEPAPAVRSCEPWPPARP